MIEKSYYEGWNVNDHYEVKQEVLAFLVELKAFDKRLKKFLGPKKVKSAGVDARRSCRLMEKHLEEIKKRIQMTRQDYDSDYEDY